MKNNNNLEINSINNNNHDNKFTNVLSSTLKKK